MTQEKTRNTYRNLPPRPIHIASAPQHLRVVEVEEARAGVLDDAVSIFCVCVFAWIGWIGCFRVVNLC